MSSCSTPRPANGSRRPEPPSTVRPFGSGAELIEAALATAPSSCTLTSRNPDKQLTIGGPNVAFGLVAGPPNVHDEVNGRRPSNLADYENFIRLAHYFNAIHIIGNQVASPLELPANTRHLDCYRANLTLSDLSFHCLSIGRGPGHRRHRDDGHHPGDHPGTRWPLPPGSPP